MQQHSPKWALWSARLVIASTLAFAITACSDDENSDATSTDTPDGSTPNETPVGSDKDAGTKPDGSSNGDGSTDGDSSTPVAKSISFTGIDVATTEAQKRAVISSTKANVSGTDVTIGYQTELRSGQTFGSNVFGRIVKDDGTPVKNADNSEFVSPSNDFSSLLSVGGKIYEITHFETTPAAMYLSELTQGADGKLTATSTKPIDFSKVGGLWTPCAGSVTPWNTHLGGEEYPPDAKVVEKATKTTDLPSADQGMLRYWGLDAATVTLDTAKKSYNPYNYGYVVEVKLDNAGTPTVTKHYAAGRRALELAYVMPDNKTVYMSDDGSNDAFYMFIAKTAGDLSEGQLYAAKWTQTSTAGAANGAANIEWIALGPSAKDVDVKALIDAGTKFADIFEIEAQASDGTCPSAANGFKNINADTGRECLKLKTGKELAASRLESRRYAAYLGATTEFRKTEGITFSPSKNSLFVSFSELNKGMMDDPTASDLGGPNHVKLQRNDCGAVYEMKLGTNATIGSNYVVTSTSALVEGIWLKAPGASTYPVGSPYNDPTFTLPDSKGQPAAATSNVCDVNGIANPDNISFLEGYDTILIGEDTTDGHQNDIVWAYNLKDKKLTRIFSTPYGSETTGVYFYPNLGGHAYIKAQIQHPYGESDTEKAGADESAKQSYTGYIGPFPAMN
ncbi:Alkaline phosphatase [Labilithrix luteola]|uniref:Alkaline phosphatase n=1 Tax=Labilithrix luteola TaxID=1391654 RepID=A0A0K1Q5F4_9BACT|nr:alkaline phosphatase PhoX [Labilithrix luteola]AKV01061.1 Alkaline phosphatase [Labilithrix luteola]